MIIKDGLVIKVKTKEGKFINATILQHAGYTEESLWWVKYQDTEDVVVVSEDNLLEWNSPKECVCGSLKVGHPGHSYYCKYV